MGKTISSIFDTADAALRVKETLRREGFLRDEIVLISSEPLPVAESEDQGLPGSRMGMFAIIGGILGAAAAVLLTVFTSKRMGVVTGGMPVVAPWPFGIIVFELTALGAILATVARMVIEARLARSGPHSEYDGAVAGGKVVLVVECVDDLRATAARKVIAQSGAEVTAQIKGDAALGLTRSE